MFFSFLFWSSLFLEIKITVGITGRVFTFTTDEDFIWSSELHLKPATVLNLCQDAAGAECRSASESDEDSGEDGVFGRGVRERPTPSGGRASEDTSGAQQPHGKIQEVNSRGYWYLTTG